MSSHTHEGPPSKSWVELKPTRSLRKLSQLTLLLGLVWEAVVLLAWLTTRPHSTAGTVLLAAAFLLGLVPLGYAAYALLIRINFDDAKVFLSKKELVLGDSFSVRVEQRALRSLKVTEMRVALVCDETVKYTAPGGQSKTRNVPLVQKWELLTRDKDTQGARNLTATRRFEIPAEKPASSPFGKKDPPFVTWKLRVVTTPAHGPHYEADFPVNVHATHSAGFWQEMSTTGSRPKIGRV